MLPRRARWGLLLLLALLLLAVGLRARGPAPPLPRREPPAERAPLVLRGEEPERGEAPAVEAAPKDEAPSPLMPSGTLSLQVRTDRGDPVAGALVQGDACALQGRTDDAGALVIALPVGPCTLSIQRADGLLVTRAEDEAIVIEDGRRTDVLVVLPAARMGGIGAALGVAPEGIYVAWVHPGSPAQEAGLAVGDLFARVGEAPTVGMTTQDFIARATGPVGTVVELAIWEDGDTGGGPRTLRLVRDEVPDLRQLPEAEAAPLRAEALALYEEALDQGRPVSVPGAVQLALARDPRLAERFIAARDRQRRPPG